MSVENVRKSVTHVFVAVGLCQVHVFRVVTPMWTGIQLPVYLQGQAVSLLALRNPEVEGAAFYRPPPCIAPQIPSSSTALWEPHIVQRLEIRPRVQTFCCFREVLGCARVHPAHPLRTSVLVTVLYFKPFPYLPTLWGRSDQLVARGQHGEMRKRIVNLYLANPR
jgi:hypothetical protein